MMSFSKSTLAAALLAGLSCLPGTASAGLLDDDEARKAIVELRTKVEAMSRDLYAKIDNKTDKSSTLDVANQNEQTKQDLAHLRGDIEVLANEVAKAQQRQKDFYVDLDTRLRKLESQKVTVDGKDAEVAPAEQKSYDNALASYKSADYKAASAALADFLRRFPSSIYAPTAQYMLGNAYYAQRDCRNAIIALQLVSKNYPDSPKAPDAMLNLASCHIELKEKALAKKTLDALIKAYPGTDAARTAKERLTAIR